MKKTLLALAIAATTAQAEVVYNPQNNTAYGESDRYNNTAFSVAVSPINNCKPVINFFTETGRQDSEDTTSFKLVVDKHTHWNITGAQLMTVDGVEIVTSKTQPNFINELRRGRTLRVQWKLATGEYAYDSFSLMGFSKAFGQAKAACKPNSDYFPSTSNESELFL